MFKTLAKTVASVGVKRAAGKYAKTLPDRLTADFGASEFYTQKQIEAAVRRAGLPARHLILAQAMYLPCSEFAPALGSEVDYDRLHALFLSKIPNVPWEEISPQRENGYAMSGGGSPGAGG